MKHEFFSLFFNKKKINEFKNALKEKKIERKR